MCTAITFRTNDHYFGRNLDLEHSYNEVVTVTPRNFPLPFRKVNTLRQHFAMIGMAAVADNYPLYYDATNEYGLSMAGLNFPDYAAYYPQKPQSDNIAPFEFIPWILGQCKTVAEAEVLLKRINLTTIDFRSDLTVTPLHWILTDRRESITIETLAGGMKIYHNPVGVLTNSPPFDFHLANLVNYLNLTNKEPTNRFAEHIDLVPYSRGMGAMGLPGDLSSASRFVRAAFTKLNSICEYDESASVGQFFHILASVAQTNGCCYVGSGFEKTIYSSCCNTDKGIYYYTTYENSQITAVHMHKTDLNATVLHCFDLITKQQINNAN